MAKGDSAVKEIFDRFSWTKENKTITSDRHHIPGLGNFTYWNYTSAPPTKPMHYHSNIIELHCMIRGMRTTQVEELNSTYIKTYTYTGNQLFLTFPFERHGSLLESESLCSFLALQLNVADTNNILGLNPYFSNLLYNQLMNLKHRQYELGQSHLSYLRIAFNFFSDLTEESFAVGTQFLCAFLFTLPYLKPVEEVHEKRIDDRIRIAIEYMHAHIEDALRIEDLAEVTGYSLSHFKAKFHKETGITPAEYILMQKMETAKNELLLSDKSITDIAYSLGFSTSNYFSSVFRKYFETTPRDYRKNHPSDRRMRQMGSGFSRPEDDTARP